MSPQCSTSRIVRCSPRPTVSGSGRDGSFERVRGIERAVRSLKLIGDEIWAVSGGPFQLGPAFRIRGAGGDFISRCRSEGEWYRCRTKRRVAPDRMVFSAIQARPTVSHTISPSRCRMRALPFTQSGWWTTKFGCSRQSSRTKVVDGPAYRWDGQRALPVPSGRRLCIRTIRYRWQGMACVQVRR